MLPNLAGLSLHEAPSSASLSSLSSHVTSIVTSTQAPTTDLDADQRVTIGLLTHDPVVLGSFRGFLLMQTLCSTSKRYETMFGCADWQLWKAAFDAVVDKPTNPEADPPLWRPLYENFTKEKPDEYAAAIRQRGAQMPRETSEELNSLARFWKKEVKNVILQKVIFGGEFSNPYMGRSPGNVLRPMNWLLAQTSKFLSRINGSATEVVRLMLLWRKKLKADFPDFPRVDVEVAIAIFDMAVKLEYDETSKKHIEQVPRVVNLLREKWR